MVTVRIPTAEELADRLTGLDRLLLAKKWERAAIVFAFTEVGEVGRGRWYKPESGRMHIREFAAQGYAGLTTNKAVSRYRDAWLTAINNGWATPVNPGDSVNLPDQPFPAWPYGMEDSTVAVTETETEPVASLDEHREHRRGPYGPRRAVEVRILENLQKIARDLSQIETVENLDEDVRDQLIDQLSAVILALRGGKLASV